MHYTQISRNNDFLAACNAMVCAWPEEEGIPSVDTVIRKVLAGGAPRFYVGYEQAYRRVCNPGFYIRVQPRTIQQQLWHDFYLRVCERRLKGGVSLAQAVADVIEREPAPSFYLSFDTARRLYFTVRRQRRLNRLRP